MPQRSFPKPDFLTSRRNFASSMEALRRLNQRLFKALVRVFLWKSIVESGEFVRIAEPAVREGIADEATAGTMSGPRSPGSVVEVGVQNPHFGDFIDWQSVLLGGLPDRLG